MEGLCGKGNLELWCDHGDPIPLSRAMPRGVTSLPPSNSGPPVKSNPHGHLIPYIGLVRPSLFLTVGPSPSQGLGRPLVRNRGRFLPFITPS